MVAAILRKMRASEAFCEWADGRTLDQVWEECDRADWMLRMAGLAKVDARVIVLCACSIARTVFRVIPGHRARSAAVVETAEAWARGESTPEQVKDAAKAFWDATWNLEGEAMEAVRAVLSAAETVSMASNHRICADAACAAANASSAAAEEAIFTTWRASSSSEFHADIIRRHISVEMIRAGLEAAK